MSALIVAAFLCFNPVAIDGDTIRCQGVTPAIRLAAIDAAELRGCRGKVGRVCVSGDPVAARNYVQGALNLGPVIVQPIRTDLYRRLVSSVITADGANLSCSVLAGKHAQPRAEWDVRHIVRRECPNLFPTPAF